VACEKPLAGTLDDAREAAEASERAGIKHMITQNFRFGPMPRTTRRLISDGAVGPPGQLDISFYVPWADRPGTHYTTEPYMFMTDMGCHHFDMMRFVLGADPTAVQALSWNQPWGWHAGDACHVAVFDFPGALKALHVAMGCSLGHQTPANGNWRIEGPEGSITWEDDRIFVSKEHRIEKKRREEVPPDDLPAHGTAAVLDEFVGAVREDREPECSARDNLATLAMTFGTVESADTGRKVNLSP
jgi:predicted dehydrogenase